MITASANIRPLLSDSIARTLASGRYLDLPDPRARTPDKEWRTRAVGRIINGLHHDQTLRAWNDFLDRLEKHHGAVRFFRFTARQASRLLINTAGTALENGGLALDRNSGQPFIPGSALKGLARREALQAIRIANPEVRSALLAIAADAFGWSPEDWTSHGDYSWATGHDQPTLLAARQTLAETRRIGVEKLPLTNAGGYVFLPAHPTAPTTLVEDVLTPHHKKYYEGIASKPMATDDEEPIPVLFPTVEAGPSWNFALFARTPTAAETLGNVVDYLTSALRLGIGAKTVAGYGRFEISEVETGVLPTPWRSVQLQFNSPAFLAGASPNRAELREPSIRGALRWWFRAIGGSFDQERRVFGGIGNPPISSRLKIQAMNLVPAAAWTSLGELNRARPQDPLGFTGYPLKASADGARTMGNGGHFGPGTKFKLEARLRAPKGPVEQDADKVLEQAWILFTMLGGIGYRTTRGYGSLGPAKAISKPSFLKYLDATLPSLGFTYQYIEANSATTALRMMDSWVKRRRTKVFYGGDGIQANRPNPLGSAASPRQSSGIHFRVLRTNDAPGYLLVAFSPPVSRILEPDSQKPAPSDLLKIPLA